MEIFYIIVMSIATIVLIILLTIIGIILSQKNNAQIYPPSKNTCPDYWKADKDAAGNAVCIINDINKGNINKDTTGNYLLSTDKYNTLKVFTPAYVDGSNKINFNDATWASGFSTTQQCALKKWSNTNKINWDGISNFNGC